LLPATAVDVVALVTPPVPVDADELWVDVLVLVDGAAAVEPVVVLVVATVPALPAAELDVAEWATPVTSPTVATPANAAAP
jgi:hypothetical protein